MEWIAKNKEVNLEENDLFKEMINVLKKEEGIDWPVLKNREKTMLLESLKKIYHFCFKKKMKILKSSYYY